MSLNRRHFIVGAAAGTGLTALVWPLWAQAQAIETVKVLCGYPAGGTTDAVSRLVDNKAGASGRLAIEEVKRSPADGSVMLLTPPSAISLFPHVYNKLSYRTEDVAPVSTACRIAFGLGVGPAVPASVKNLKDFLAWAKSNVEQANYGSPGAGTPPHFLGALLGKESGVDLRHVPYRGSAPGIQDLLGGQVTAMSSPIGDYLPHLKEGRLRLLATSGATRSRFAPDVPTYTEQGFKNLVMNEYYEFFLPGKAPAEVVRRAADAVKSAVASPDVVEAFAKLGLEAMANSPAELAQLIKAEDAQWGPIVKQVGFKPED